METREQAQKAEGTAHRRAGDTKQHGKQQTQPETLMVGSQFKEPLLYGGQGEHSNCLAPTLLATPHHGLGQGPKQNTDLPGHQNDMHSKEACSITARKTMDDRRQSTTDNAGANPPNPQIPGNPVSRTIDSTISTLRVESDNTGLNLPRLEATGEPITGASKKWIYAENRKRRRALQQAEQATPLWTMHNGTRILPAQAANKSRPTYRNSMCPAGLAAEHPAAAILMEWAQFGCPAKTGEPWIQVDIEEAIERGPHQLALSPETIQHFAEEIKEKIRTNQARVIKWDTIKVNPLPGLKISPIAAIPHKSKAFWSILDPSFQLRLRNGGFLDAVNDTTEKTSPGRAIDQIGECLTCIIHAFAKAGNSHKIFMANWDIKDGFW